MKAAYLKPGSLEWQWFNIPDNSDDDNLALLRILVDGDIESVPNYYNKVVMYCNEEGKIFELTPNIIIFDKPNSNYEIDVIVGPIVMLGPIDEDGRTTHLTEEMLKDTEKIISYIK